jgi:geranylgeranyl diphosphate synthase, type II
MKPTPIHSNINIDAFISGQQKRFNQLLRRTLPSPQQSPQTLHRAMHYAVCNGGKRIRPLLVYLVGHTCGLTVPNTIHHSTTIKTNSRASISPATTLDAAACAVELIHTFSLIHDDLPCIDNDDYRRGKPSCHKAFDEATALLAGDALQLLAIATLNNNCHTIDTENRSVMIATLIQACGSRGLIGGEFLDVQMAQKKLPPPSLNQLKDTYLRKTSALIQASVRLGALAAAASARQLQLLDEYAKCIGLAFQIQDDVLELSASAPIQPHTHGDERGHTATIPTYPALIGVAESKKIILNLHHRAHRYLQALSRTTYTCRNKSHQHQHQRNKNNANLLDVTLLTAFTDKYILQRQH